MLFHAVDEPFFIWWLDCRDDIFGPEMNEDVSIYYKFITRICNPSHLFVPNIYCYKVGRYWSCFS